MKVPIRFLVALSLLAAASQTLAQSSLRITPYLWAAGFEGNVGASGADLNLSTASITAGGTVSVSSFTYTQQGTA